jgi:hypothetical protein
MSGGTISGNTAQNYTYIDYSGNPQTLYGSGGGVYIAANDNAGNTFTKTGGTIDAANTAEPNRGAVVFTGDADTPDRHKETASGPGQKLYAKNTGTWTYSGPAPDGAVIPDVPADWN